MNYGIRILVVEDLLTTRLFFKRTLKKLGFNNVVVTENGHSALNELKAGEFDLIISDWHMPKMDGLAFFKALKKSSILKKIPFVLITVEKEKNRVMEAMKAGVDQYLVKPVDPQELDTRIQEVFASLEA